MFDKDLTKNTARKIRWCDCIVENYVEYVDKPFKTVRIFPTADVKNHIFPFYIIKHTA
jgi:hypothetical protein